MNFHELHHQAQALLIGNVWDAASAQTAEAAGLQALGTSSAALSAVFGYADGEAMPFELLLGMVRRISAVTFLPLSVDLEAGYADDPQHIADNIRALVALGVVGINLEDSRVHRGQRVQQPMEHFADRLAVVRSALGESGTSVFINARTDTFLLGRPDALGETLRRGQCYAEAGANGLFVPCIALPADIATVAHGVPLPLNVMGMPGLPDFAQLSTLGVKRISMGHWLHTRLQAELANMYGEITGRQSFAKVLG